jgi:uncharacterized iron-regulated membrane protein
MWQQWLRRPQNTWLRKALFQVHLWTGIGVGLYVLAISITGSAIVFRNELYQWASQRPAVTPSGDRLPTGQFRAKVLQAYPGYEIANVWPSRDPAQPTEVWLDKGGSRLQRLFDPYNGRDMGRSVAYTIRILSWCGDLHANLFGGDRGRQINGIGAAFLAILCMTGLLIWWPGVNTWKRSLWVNPRANWKRLNWDLHSAFGFWTASIILMWGLTGIYLGFPETFQRWVNEHYPLEYYRIDFGPKSEVTQPAPVWFVPVLQQAAPGAPQGPAQAGSITQPAPGKQGRRRRPPPHLSTGDKIIRWMYYLHFGNFSGWGVKLAWLVLGLVPPLLLVTGLIMWWNRVLSSAARETRRRAALAENLPAEAQLNPPL